MSRSKKSVSVVSPQRDIRPRGFRTRVTTPLRDDGRTDQSQEESTNVNNIVKQFKRTGIMPSGSEGIYVDVTRFSHLNPMELQEEIDRLHEEARALSAEIASAQKAQEEEDQAVQIPENPTPTPPEPPITE